MPKICGVQMDDPRWRQGRRDEGPVSPLALLESTADHDLRGAKIILAADGIGLEITRVSSSVVAIVALLLALRQYLLTRFIHILHKSRRCRLREQLQL